MKSKKIIRVVCLLLAAVIFVVCAGGYVMFEDELHAIGTIKRLDSGILFLEYNGDYGFDKFIEQGGAPSDAKMAVYISKFLSKGFYKMEAEPQSSNFACSTIAAKTASGDCVMGRNFDWDDCRGMVVKTKPDNAFSSVSTVNIDFLGFGDSFDPEGSIENKFLALSSVYVPLDGINEKGLAVADLVVGDGELGETHQDTEKPDVTTVSAIRLLLDYAADVDEALRLLGSFDMNSSVGAMHHLSISDAKGRSVVVEYINNEMVVTDTQCVTNFYLAPGSSYGLGGDTFMARERYDMLEAVYKKANGVLTEEDVKNALMSVSSKTLKRGVTQWSVVYNNSKSSLQLWYKESYSQGLSFEPAK